MVHFERNCQNVPGAAGAAAGAVAAASAAASAVCIYYVDIGGALRAPLYVHDKIHTAEAAAAAPAAASLYQAFAGFQVDTKGLKLNGGHFHQAFRLEPKGLIFVKSSL